MKIIIHIIIIVFMFFSSCWAAINIEDIEKKVIILMIESAQGQSRLEEAIEILSTAIEDGYNKNKLLKLRAQVYEMQGNLQKSRDDIATILESKPNSVEYLLWKCLLDEALGVDKALCLKCYDQVIQRKKALLGDKKNHDIEYILLLLLAENPDGPRMAKEFIEILNGSEADKIYRDILSNFNREEFIRSRISE